MAHDYLWPSLQSHNEHSCDYWGASIGLDWVCAYHGLPQEETTDGVAIVEVCETKCAESQEVEKHTAVHTEEKPNNSKNGDSKTGKQVNNEDLITGHTSVKSPAYTEYKNTLKGENYLNEHTAVHTDGKLLQCTKSGDTNSEKNSQAQLAKHTGETVIHALNVI